MGTVTTGWQDYGTYLRVYADIPLRRNGLPNHAAREAAEALLATLVPGAFDPVEPVPEGLARAAIRDGAVDYTATYSTEITESEPPLPDFGIPLLDAGLLPDDDEIIFPRACPAGGCGEE